MMEDLNGTLGIFNIIGFFDDGLKAGTIVNEYKVWGGIDDLNARSSSLALIVAVGTPGTRRKIVENVSNANVFFPSVLDKTVQVGDAGHVEIGKGCIICGGTVITTNVRVGDFVILNLGCTVGHDTIIGDYASFMPSVNISGEVRVGESVYVGTGAKIINQLEIGRDAVVGAGAVVAKSLPSRCTAVGVPAKPIKFF